MNENEFRVRIVRGPEREDLRACKDAALATIGKRTVNEPDDKWLFALADAEHSPIRELVWKLEIEAPYWVLNELRTHHVGCEMYMQSSRNDRQSDFDRNKAPQGMVRTARLTANLQALMNISHKRLCGNASKEMRRLARMMFQEITAAYPWTDGLFVPECVYRGGKCHEVKTCGMCPWAHQSLYAL